MTNYSYSYSTGSPAPDAATETLWSFNSADVMPGPGDAAILHSRRSGAGMLVQPDVVRALELCAPFRSLDAHTQHITDLLPALKNHAQHTRQTLSHIAEQGLMESSKVAFQRITAPPEVEPSQPPSRIFILTCDRPESLKQLLSRTVTHELPDDVEGIWVIDDSRDLHHAQTNASIALESASTSNTAVHYFGAEARASLIDHLCTAEPELTASIYWLLDRADWGDAPTHGIARNIAQLLSVNKRALVMDDDTLPEAIIAPKANTGFRFSGVADREAMFFQSADELEEHALKRPESPVVLMLQSLGAPLGPLVSQHMTHHLSLRGANGSLLSRFNNQSSILLTQCGSWGDSGTRGLRWLLSLPVASIRNLLGSGAAFQDALSQQHCWAGHSGATVTSYGALSQWTGLDNSALLPPYLPAGRNEDLLFGIMLQRCHPESAVLNADWAIRHTAPDNRAEAHLAPISVNPGISLLAEWLGREPLDQYGLSARRRLSGLAEDVHRLAEMTPHAAAELIEQRLAGTRSAVLNQCMKHFEALNQLTDLPGKAAWQQFLATSRDELVREIQKPSPTDTSLLSGGGLVGIDALQKHAAQFADALNAWPALRAAAATRAG